MPSDAAVTHLLDANILIALVDPDHVHHEKAGDWFGRVVQSFSTCPITQGSLVRHLLRAGHPSGEITTALERIQHLPAHVFWPDDLSFGGSIIDGLVEHRQVTDAYLCALARKLGGQVATFDRGLAAVHPDITVLVPIG